MKLIGSLASPFVRRIRLQLANDDYEFEVIDVFSENGKETMAKYSPTLRVPILIDNEIVLWDSLLITEYLSKNQLDFELKKKLILINELTDSGVQLFQMRKFKTDEFDKSVFSQNNLSRIKTILDLFEREKQLRWDIVGQWLFCTLDWFRFRNVYSWQEQYPKLFNYVENWSKEESAIKTNPRN